MHKINKVKRDVFFPSCFFLFSFFSFLPMAHSQESRWYEQFFIEGSVIHYYLPELVSELMEPQPGFRGALGYEYRNFRLAFESGYTRIEGTNPLVLETTMIPLSVKLDYNLSLLWGLGVQADLRFGVLFSRTMYYKSALDMITKKIQDEQVKSPFTGGRLYLTYIFPFEWLKLYAGGGVDMVFETDGPIPQTVIEAGISIKPIILLLTKTRKTEAAQTEDLETKPEEPETPQAEISTPKKPRGTVLSQKAVYFWADSAILIEEYRFVLDEAGRQLRANPTLRVTLQGYTAPLGTEDGMLALSAARSWYCVEYLMKHYGITEDRMNIEFYGADETADQKPKEYRRRVDIFIEQEVE